MTARLAVLLAAAWAAPAHAADSAPSPATLTPLSVTAIGKNTFMVRDPLTLSFSDGAPSITVPAGFVTDLGSTQKALRWSGKTEPSLAPAVLHDYLYWYQPCTQEEADAMMHRAMVTLGTTPAAAAAAFQAVGSGGSATFKKNSERRRGGEVRTFTAAHTQAVVQSSSFGPNETLESALRKAQSVDGLVKNELSSPAVKLTCARVLHQCKTCLDLVARKKTPKTRVAKQG